MTELHLIFPTINGIALIIWFVAMIVTTIIGYCCGRRDGRNAERNKCVEILEKINGNRY